MGFAAASLELPPFSFRLDGQPFRSPPDGWRREQADAPAEGGRLTRVTFTEPSGRLRVSADVRRFEGFPALDWVLHFDNPGRQDTPILSDVLPLDWAPPAPPGDRVLLHHANGSLCRIDDFLPLTADLTERADVRLAPVGGRSSNGVLPFMNLQHGSQGLVVAIGWSGQWAARFRREGPSLHLSAGLERTHLRLRPGEGIRTPRILLLPWEGPDPMCGNNLLRRLLLAHYLPRIDGRLVLPPTACCIQAYFYLTDQASEALEQQVTARTAGLGLDARWLDACWYGRSGRQWWQEVGSWTVNRQRFPNGLAPVAEAARRAGMKFILWFEPERVRQGSELHAAHPEFLLTRDGDADNLLLDLGNPAARQHVTDLISRRIDEIGVDVYRQDCNFDLLPYWHAADTPDRVGIAETRHVEGLYAFWDELRRRHPGLWIDNCASGGRRIDLETLSRSLPLWPTDFADVPGLSTGLNLHVGSQCAGAGLARWVPLFGSAVWNFEPYALRSHVPAGFAFGYHLPAGVLADATDSRRKRSFKDVLAAGCSALDDGFPRDLAAAAIAEWKSLQPMILGDFHLLVPLTTAEHDWSAFQFHRHDLRAGFAVFLRRHRSPFPAMRVELRDINPAGWYDVSLSPTFDEADKLRLTGEQLASRTVTIDQRPGSLLLRYAEAT